MILAHKCQAVERPRTLSDKRVCYMKCGEFKKSRAVGLANVVFNVAALMVREFVKTMEADLKLTSAMVEEWHNDIPSEVLEADLNNELPSFRSIHLLVPFLSPLARYKWGKAFEKGGKKQEEFLKDIKNISELIEYSLSLKE